MAASRRAASGEAGSGQAIVWRNVVLMGLLHLGAVYALSLVPRAQLLTLLWGECGGGAGPRHATPRRATGGAGDSGGAPARLGAGGFLRGRRRGESSRVSSSACLSPARLCGRFRRARSRADVGRAPRRAPRGADAPALPGGLRRRFCLLGCPPGRSRDMPLPARRWDLGCCRKRRQQPSGHICRFL